MLLWYFGSPRITTLKAEGEIKRGRKRKGVEEKSNYIQRIRNRNASSFSAVSLKGRILWSNAFKVWMGKHVRFGILQLGRLFIKYGGKKRYIRRWGLHSRQNKQ